MEEENLSDFEKLRQKARKIPSVARILDDNNKVIEYKFDESDECMKLRISFKTASE